MCYKLLEGLALQRISPTVDGLLSPDQAGFRKGRSTCDQVAALTTFIENGFQQNLKTGAMPAFILRSFSPDVATTDCGDCGNNIYYCSLLLIYRP